MNIVGYATSFASGIFKAPQTKDGFAKFIVSFASPSASEWAKTQTKIPYIQKFISRQPMTAKEKSDCTRKVLALVQSWTKAQKESLQQELANIRIISEPKAEPIVTHSISSAYNKQGQTQTIQKSAQINEEMIKTTSKIPIIILASGIGVLLLSKLLRGSK